MTDALRLGQLGLVALLANTDEMFGARSLRLEKPERVIENLARNGAAIHPQHGFRVIGVGRVFAYGNDRARASLTFLVPQIDAALNEFADHALDHPRLGEIDVRRFGLFSANMRSMSVPRKPTSTR